MDGPSDADRLLDVLELTDYEATALAHLVDLGRTTAPDLAEATGIPKARIYGVLDSLADAGFVKIFPGRPKEYQPKPPEEILDRAIENRRQEFESYSETVSARRDAFLERFQPRFERSTEEVTPTEELFHVVDVGEPSERETRRLYHEAEREIAVLTKSFEYFDTVAPAVRDALDRGIGMRVLFLQPEHLQAENREIQRSIVRQIRTDYPEIEMRFSPERLPWRGTIVDPSLEYDSGEAILLVEEEDIPLSLRQAAVTENAPFVAGMKRYFDLIWEHESVGRDDLDGATDDG